MKKMLNDFYPYYWTDTDENGDYIVTIYNSKEDKDNFTNGRTYKASINLSPSVKDCECMKTTINGINYYFG